MKNAMISICRIGLFLFCVMCRSWMAVDAQNVSNVTAEQVGKTIHVSYDLEKQADITLFLSTNGGSTYTQLYHVSGDVGENVSAGHKIIVWDVLAEREKLVGENIMFKVRAQGEDDNLTFTVNGVTFKMIYVKGGTFTMGCTSEQGGDCDISEEPAHSVTLSDFWMGETEVTQALWEAVMGSLRNRSYYRGKNLPVENVSWNDCQEFIQTLNEFTEKTFRLPTEAEWEYAARGGYKGKGYKYSGSNNINDVAWYTTNTKDKGAKSVMTKQPNELGLYGMSCNVWEWCSDWYGSYSSSSQINPTGPSSGSSRVLRGGGWYLDGSCRVSYRFNTPPDSRSYGNGFRLSLVR